jgi:hypothetical protein
MLSGIVIMWDMKAAAERMFRQIVGVQSCGRVPQEHARDGRGNLL